MNVDLQSPRVAYGGLAGVVLLGFVVDFRLVVVLAALVPLARFVQGRVEQGERTTCATEIGLLVVAGLLFLLGRAGWGWVLASLAAGVAALAAAADVWILPDRG